MKCNDTKKLVDAKILDTKISGSIVDGKYIVNG